MPRRPPPRHRAPGRRPHGAPRGRDYERYFDLDGQRYCHLLDARTGRPVRYWQSISVCAPICVLAGSYATIAMLLESDALPFLDAQQVSYLAVPRDGNPHGSARIAARPR